ncbi:MAG: DUF3795 domain-containing protein [Candidatus Heimdallarchaeota archaeon]|nr:DUF3795 domain-containing protein [Candidatus Heimdallarchaeota archaeon]
MSLKEYNYGHCGVFCEMCPTGNQKIATLAMELQKLTQGEYEWAQDSVNFRFEDLTKGLDWLSKVNCPGCHHITEPWCEVLKCRKANTLSSCLLCSDFLKCERTEYHRNRYPFVVEHHARVKEVGLEQHLKEERCKTQRGVQLIDIRSF